MIDNTKSTLAMFEYSGGGHRRGLALEYGEPKETLEILRSTRRLIDLVKDFLLKIPYEEGATFRVRCGENPRGETVYMMISTHEGRHRTQFVTSALQESGMSFSQFRQSLLPVYKKIQELGGLNPTVIMGSPHYYWENLTITQPNLNNPDILQ
jgi:hypothetical protein